MYINKLSTTLSLFLVIFIEGYVVLSSELIAIRQTIPYAGSGTETASIIIAAVLMPLAFGYYAGGQFKPCAGKSIRKKLIRNILISMIFLLPALSYILIKELHIFASEQNIHNRLVFVGVYSALFIAPPVYLLGQTIPLISNYFNKQTLARATGKILFISTLGSFCGAVFCTLVLMATIGVNNAASLNFLLLLSLVFILTKKKFSWAMRFAGIMTFIAIILNSNAAMLSQNIIQSNQYNTIAVLENEGERHLLLNNSYSSKYSDNGERYIYIAIAEDLAMKGIRYANPPKDILVIGAGAFTFGIDDEHNNYDFIDIDPNLKNIAEDYILMKDLTPNKTFHPVSARGFLTENDKKYDVVFLDTYFGKNTMPEHLITADFFAQIKSRLKDDSVIVMNMVTSQNFASAFSRNLDSTIRAIFPYVNRHVLKDEYDLWNGDKQTIGNVLYVYRHWANIKKPAIYTDNKNTSYLDKI